MNGIKPQGPTPANDLSFSDSTPKASRTSIFARNARVMRGQGIGMYRLTEFKVEGFGIAGLGEKIGISLGKVGEWGGGV